ncbi:hypothetical protein GCM10022421_19180 [Oceanisphaera sediminis]|uniref:CHASE2 domain-containing protein n=1 Tax=Oceanisphaera sediminis TaxID=981381 RepID=A0ABP7E1V7_9GAMM
MARELLKLPNWIRRLFHAFLLTLLMWAVLVVSPFGFGEHLDKYVQDLINTQAGHWIYPDTRQDEVVVLLLTDEIVDAVLRGQWPAPYSFHASILDDLLVHQPRALFIDFYWMNQLKPGAEELVDVLKNYRAAGIEVYLSAPSQEWLNNFWPELAGLVIPVSPQIVMDPMDFVARAYTQGNNELPSAAFAIVNNLNHGLENTEFRGDMDIFWGTKNNIRNQAWMTSDTAQDDCFLDSLLRGFTQVETPVPYSTTVFVRDLINPVGRTEDEALAELDDHLKDRVVVYGASLTGIQDVVFTPTREILPGAYYHAMALDNLLTWGEQFKAATPRWPDGMEGLSLPWLQFFLLLPIACFVCFRKTNNEDSQREDNDYLCYPTFFGRLCGFAVSRIRQSYPTLRFWLAILFYVTLVCWIQFSLLDLSVATWAGFIEIFGAGIVLERLSLVERITSFPKRLYRFYQPQEGVRSAENNHISDAFTDNAGRTGE